jgi:lysophospholipase L1-like esterase
VYDRDVSSREPGQGVLPRRALYPWLALLLGIVLAGGLIEAVVRVTRPKASYERWHAASLRYLLDSEVDWKLEPGAHPWGRINADHFRGPPVPKEKPADVFRIVVLGGSAAFDLYKPDAKSWPRLLEGRLNRSQPAAREGVRYQVLNAGTPGYSTWQSVRLLESKIFAWNPDLVLVYHLYNDSLAFRFDDAEKIVDGWRLNALANHLSPAAHAHVIWDALGKVLPHAGDYLRQQWIQYQGRQRLKENAAYWHRPQLGERAHAVGVGFYLSNLERMAELCRQHGVQLGIVTQASVIREHPDPEQRRVIDYAFRGLPQAELWASYERAWQMAADLAERHEEVLLLPAHSWIPPTPEMFHDEVHLTDRGSERLSELVAQELQAALLKPAPAQIR